MKAATIAIKQFTAYYFTYKSPKIRSVLRSLHKTVESFSRICLMSLHAIQL